MEGYIEDEWQFDFRDGRGSVSVSEMTGKEAKQALCEMISEWVELEDIRDSISDFIEKHK